MFTLPVLALLATAGAQAQTIFAEDFETGNKGSAPLPIGTNPGWTIVKGYQGAKTEYNWYNEWSTEENNSLGGLNYAHVTGPLIGNETEGLGPREEILLTPELDLNDTYQLQFSFCISPVYVYDNYRYDFQVRVVEDDNLDGAENVFTLQNEKIMRDAGLVESPLPGWGPHTATVDLSDFKGSKVKIAFVFKMFTEYANSLSLDDITVTRFTPPTGPVPQLSLTRYDFGTLYIGEKQNSDIITLRNVGKDGLTVTSIDTPAGVTTTLKPGTFNLLRNQSVDFRLVYDAAMTSAAKGDVVLHTSGGDINLAISAAKEFVPEGYSYEGFEEFCPPAGWTTQGWAAYRSPIEGDYSANADGDYSATWLRSPMLDLSNGGQVMFTYYNLFASDDPEDAPEYDITLQVSYDGGETWTDKWKSDYLNNLNQVLTDTVDLGMGTGEDYIRWYYPAVETDDEGAYSHSSFYLDRVLLPNVVGVGGVPGRTNLISPANNTDEVYPEGVKLQWGHAQFATGYKLYVGTTNACNELVNGLDLGRQYSYELPRLDYETTYMWRVVAYNEVGDATSKTTWRFTTQKDASVSEYPYEEAFEDGKLPTGWVTTTTSQYATYKWSINNYFPYVFDNKNYGVMFSGWLYAGETNDLATSDFILPADKNMAVSFKWSDSHPSDVKVDPTGDKRKVNIEPDNGRVIGEFQICPEGGEWKTLTTISTEYACNDNWWYDEKVDLAPYRGQKVKFRWLHTSLMAGGDDGLSVTYLRVDENKDYVAGTNYSSWDAGKVNYGKSVSSADRFVLFNQGNKELTVQSVETKTPNFTTSLKAGDKIAADANLKFTVTFNALETAAKVQDVLTVVMDGDAKVEVPLYGEALPEGTYYYSFEPNDAEYKWDQDFTMIDADNSSNFMFTTSWVGYSKNGQKSAFSLESDAYESGMYGMMNPVSGLYALVAASPQSVKADNWLIYQQVTPRAGAKLDFWCRNYDSEGTYDPDPLHRVTVLVSETGNTKTADFTPVMECTEIPLLGYQQWQHYEVDLSAYAGKPVYVAVQHTTDAPSNLSFWDDFTFSNVDLGEVNAVTDITADGTDANIQYYNLQGMRLSERPATGLYIERRGNTAFKRVAK